MSIFDITRYLRAIFVLLPVGILLIYWGLEGLKKSVDDLPYSNGTVENFHTGKMYFKNCKCRVKTFFIYINEDEKPYVTSITEHIELLTKNINLGDSVEIWTWEKYDDNQIEQIKIHGEVIIPYNKTIGLYLGFLVIGISLTALCLFYIIKSPEDLLGKKKD